MSAIISNIEESSEIQKFYTGCKIFITGGSGFLGNLLIQKLIRDCPDLSKIYLLMRPNKKFATSKERFDNMLQDIVFEKMRKEQPNYAEKFELVTGDLGTPDLGLSEDDKKLLSREVNIIFHIAATVNFLETIKKAAAINIKATRDVINLAKTMTNLKAFVYCSTAFSNCVHKEIDEIFYDMPHSPERILKITEVLDDDDLEVLTPRNILANHSLGIQPSNLKIMMDDAILHLAEISCTPMSDPNIVHKANKWTPEYWRITLQNHISSTEICGSTLFRLLGDWPNTYTFTKGLAEILIKEEGQGLPIAIIRPSMVISTVSDPVDGWINNVYGPVGLSTGVGLGIVHVGVTDLNLSCDLVPADYVINSIIATVYHIGTNYENGENNVYAENHIKTSDNLTIFNYVNSENPLTWRRFRDISIKSMKWQSMHSVWYCFTIYSTNIYSAKFLQFFLHTIPGYLMDFLLFLKGKKRRMVKMYAKINLLTCLTSYFSTQQWKFKNDNTQELWKQLNNTDRKIFPFSMRELDWENYFAESFWKGIRVYICKDPLETIPRALKRYKKLTYLHFTVVYTFYIIFAIILLKIFLIFV